jgi:hypothetical protein
MYWGFITSDGIGMLLKCSNRMTAYDYLSIMERAAVPACSSFGMMYIDDNAPIHRAHVVQQWKAQYGVPCLDWPPYSPDMNPIENVWSYLKKKIQRFPNRPQTLEELDFVVLSIWGSIPLTYITSLYDSMPERLKKCMTSKGYPIAY